MLNRESSADLMKVCRWAYVVAIAILSKDVHNTKIKVKKSTYMHLTAGRNGKRILNGE